MNALGAVGYVVGYRNIVTLSCASDRGTKIDFQATFYGLAHGLQVSRSIDCEMTMNAAIVT